MIPSTATFWRTTCTWCLRHRLPDDTPAIFLRSANVNALSGSLKRHSRRRNSVVLRRISRPCEYARCRRRSITTPRCIKSGGTSIGGIAGRVERCSCVSNVRIRSRTASRSNFSVLRRSRAVILMMGIPRTESCFRSVCHMSRDFGVIGPSTMRSGFGMRESQVLCRPIGSKLMA